MGQPQRLPELLDGPAAGEITEQDQGRRPGGAVARDRRRGRLQLVGEGEREGAEEVRGPRNICVTHTYILAAERVVGEGLEAGGTREARTGFNMPGMENTVRVCPFCGEPPGAGVFCEACGRNLSAVERLPTRAEWEASAPSGPPMSQESLAERCAAAVAAFLAAMHAAGDPGVADTFPRGSGLRRAKHPKAWVLRKVAREPDDDDLQRYEPGLVLTVEGSFHVLESEVRGWGQRDFPRFVDTAAAEPIAMPVEARLLGELEAVAREHGVAAEPPRASP